MQRACETEGGLHIEERADVRGYWHGAADWSGLTTDDCTNCANQVARGDFDYVDYFRPGRARRKPAGFVRFQLGAAHRSACYEGVLFSKPPAGTCVAIVQLDGPPGEGYKYESRRLTKADQNGTKLTERRRTILEVRSQRIIASYTYFEFSTALEEIGAFAPRLHCNDPQEFSLSDRKFVIEVLRTSSRTAEE